MPEIKPNWSYNEFLAYLLLYAANADFEVSKEEKEVLLSFVDKHDYKAVLKDFESRNDYERLQFIEMFKEDYYNNDMALEKLLADLKEVFLADDQYNSIEKAVFMGLRRILL